MFERMRRRRPSSAMVVAMVALVSSFAGPAVADQAVDLAKKATFNGSKIKARSISGSKLKNNTVTGKQVAEGKLGKVPKAKTADSATSATNAAHANSADSATTASGLTAAGDFNTSFTFNTGWVDDTSASGNFKVEPYAVGYYKDREGFIHLRGAADRISGTSSLIGTLPSGARPPGTPGAGYIYFAVYTTAGVAGSVFIGADGTVTRNSGNIDFVSLDGITFRQGN